MPDLMEAIEKLKRNLPSLKVETVPLPEAVRRLVAIDFFAPEDLPPFPRSAMDGYAVRSEDIVFASRQNPAILTVVDAVQTGSIPNRPVGHGEAVIVATGALIPEGADTVVPVENTRPLTPSEFSPFAEVGGKVSVLVSVPRGKNVSPRGEDLKKGEEIVKVGTRITPAHIGLLASCGFWEIPVFAKPKAAVIPTGSEIVPTQAKPSIGQVRNSTAWAVAASLKECGVEPVVFDSVPDDLETLRKRFSEAVESFDLVFTCGGVSVGQQDLVREAWKGLGAQLLFWHLPLRPGKNALALICQGKLAVGLSGNPSAALTTFDLLLRPILCKWTGAREGELLEQKAELTEPVEQVNGFVKVVRIKLLQNGNKLLAQPLKGQLSTVLSSLAQADGYAIIPSGNGKVPVGAVVKVLVRRDRLSELDRCIVGFQPTLDLS